MARTERQDEIEYCERCGISFLWSAEEQKREADMPRLCSGCRRLLPQADRVRGAVRRARGRRRRWGQSLSWWTL